MELSNEEIADRVEALFEKTEKMMRENNKEDSSDEDDSIKERREEDNKELTKYLIKKCGISNVDGRYEAILKKAQEEHGVDVTNHEDLQHYFKELHKYSRLAVYTYGHAPLLKFFNDD